MHPDQRARLEKRLEEVVSQLLRSVEAYQVGHTDEARRMALSVRILLHDTKRQTSLLEHLGFKDSISMYDTASEIDPRQYGSHLALLSMLVPIVDGKPGSPRVDARLDNQPTSPKPEMQPFETWWATPVIRDDNGSMFSRQDIVLFLADKDGGAHVDLHVDPKYLRLATGEACEWRPYGSGVQAFSDSIELATARQVAHEVLVTLARHHPQFFEDDVVARRYASEPIPQPVEAAEITDMRVYREAESLGRNDHCWCGSNRKYKYCHDSVAAKTRHDAGKQSWPV